MSARCSIRAAGLVRLSRELADVGDLMRTRAALPHRLVTRNRWMQSDPVLAALWPDPVQVLHNLVLHELSYFDRDQSLGQPVER